MIKESLHPKDITFLSILAYKYSISKYMRHI